MVVATRTEEPRKARNTVSVASSPVCFCVLFFQICGSCTARSVGVEMTTSSPHMRSGRYLMHNAVATTEPTTIAVLPTSPPPAGRLFFVPFISVMTTPASSAVCWCWCVKLCKLTQKGRASFVYGCMTNSPTE